MRRIYIHGHIYTRTPTHTSGECICIFCELVLNKNRFLSTVVPRRVYDTVQSKSEAVVHHVILFHDVIATLNV